MFNAHEWNNDPDALFSKRMHPMLSLELRNGTGDFTH